jgi:26S proteasome regulatory subunit N2
MLSYAFQVVMSLIQNRGFRNTVLRCLVGLYKNLNTPDYVSMCQCLIFLDDALAVAELLDKLSKGSENCALMAYQIGFDLYESATQQFLGRVLQALKSTAPVPGALIVKAIVKPDNSTPVSSQTKAECLNLEIDDSKLSSEETGQRNVANLVNFF